MRAVCLSTMLADEIRTLVCAALANLALDDANQACCPACHRRRPPPPASTGTYTAGWLCSVATRPEWLSVGRMHSVRAGRGRIGIAPRGRPLCGRGIVVQCSGALRCNLLTVQIGIMQGLPSVAALLRLLEKDAPSELQAALLAILPITLDFLPKLPSISLCSSLSLARYNAQQETCSHNTRWVCNLAWLVPQRSRRCADACGPRGGESCLPQRRERARVRSPTSERA